MVRPMCDRVFLSEQGRPFPQTLLVALMTRQHLIHTNCFNVQRVSEGQEELRPIQLEVRPSFRIRSKAADNTRTALHKPPGWTPPVRKPDTRGTMRAAHLQPWRICRPPERQKLRLRAQWYPLQAPGPACSAHSHKSDSGGRSSWGCLRH